MLLAMHSKQKQGGRADTNKYNLFFFPFFFKDMLELIEATVAGW